MIRLFLLISLVLLTTACNRNTYTWNQRMTVTVETPDGIVSGSSVVEVTALYCNPGCGLAGDIEVNYSYRGEAVAVEVFPGQWLFALIENPAELMYAASPDQFGGIPRHERGRWLAATPRQTEAVEFLPDHAPTLAAFANISDPWTANELDWHDLSPAFGSDVRLLSITLEITNDPFNSGSIRSILPHLGEYLGDRLVDTVDPWSVSFAQSLRTRDFVRQ